MMVVLLQAGNHTALTDSGAYPAMLWQLWYCYDNLLSVRVVERRFES